MTAALQKRHSQKAMMPMPGSDSMPPAVIRDGLDLYQTRSVAFYAALIMS
jgi:hypothetical protein